MASVVHPRRRSVTTGKVLQVGILCVLLVLSAVPIVMMITMSLRPTAQIYTNFFALPWPLYFNNYTSALVRLIAPLLRTLLVYVLSIVLMLSFAAAASYAFARIRSGRAKLFYLIILVMMIPGHDPAHATLHSREPAWAARQPARAGRILCSCRAAVRDLPAQLVLSVAAGGDVRIGPHRWRLRAARVALDCYSSWPGRSSSRWPYSISRPSITT